MDACIARGGISHVLSQARASLKNPSRPYTPRTTARPLFHGDDYRPGSRPSSSYTVTEQKELQKRQQNTKSSKSSVDASAPPASMLPPRSSSSSSKKASKKTSEPQSCPEDPDLPVAMTASASHLKLVHAPLIPDEEKAASTGHHDIYKHEVGSDADSDPKSDTEKDGEDHLEASLELPSQDQMYQTYTMAERSLEELTALSDKAKAAEAIEHLRAVLSSFLHLSSFFLSSNSHAPSLAAEMAKVQELRAHLFQAISSAVLEQWSHSAECVLALTPCLFELYTGASNDNSSQSEQQLISLAKLLFMLSKESANDAAFCNVQYVEAALSVISNACSHSGSSGSHRSSTSKKHRVARRESPESATSSDEEEPHLQIDHTSLAFPMKMLIYVAGTLKNTSNAEDKMLKLLATNGAIAILSDTMRWRSSDSLQSKEIAQLLIQTTGVLRNLSVAKSYHKQFLEALVPARLCAAIPAFITHLELMGNVSRILSKLTLHELPRAQINQRMGGNLRSLMAVVDCSHNKALSFLEQQQQRSENRFQDILLIRMFFVLGNLCAGNDRNRQYIAFDCQGIPVLLQALQFYATQYAKQRDAGDTASGGNGDDEQDGDAGSEQSGEVLVKLVRLLANLAINADVGATLNGDNARMSTLLETLDQAQRVGDEELMLNIVSCITNLSYYSSPLPSSSSSQDRGSSSSPRSFIEGNRIVITSLLAQILLDRNEEAVVEATRAFGNLSRFKDVLCYMSEHKVLDCFVVLLDHSNREIVYTVCGVLMNAALDEPTRRQLLRVRPEGGNGTAADGDRSDVRTLLLGIVECAATDDVDMTCIACKVLYNLLLASDSKSGDADAFSGATLYRIVQQIIKTMDAHDSRRHANQKSSAGRKMKRADDEYDDADDGDDDDGHNGSWRELRLVLPQLLRSAAS